MRENICVGVGGMVCPNCATRLEAALKELPGIAKIQASFAQGTIQFSLVGQASREKILDDVAKIIAANDYTYLGERKVRSPIWQLGRACVFLACVLGVAYIFSQILPGEWVNFFPEPDSKQSLLALVGIGLLTSLHCLAMCGGIVLSHGVLSVRPKQTWPKVLKKGLAYQCGRLISYTLTGVLAGLIGQSLVLTPQVRGMVMMVAAMFMVVLAINLLGFLPILSQFIPKPPKWLAKLVQERVQTEYSGYGPSFCLGLANGFMPCGPLQAMQLYALGCGNALLGGLAMFLFGLGTVAAMLGFSVCLGFLSSVWRARICKVAVGLILFLAIGLWQNGLALTGKVPVQVAANAKLAQVLGEQQYVTSYADYDAYEPLVVQKDVPVVWKLIVPEDKLIGCNNEIVVPSLDIKVKLRPGENKIAFTPTHEGTFSYTCWMGMIKSTITVVANLKKLAP